MIVNTEGKIPDEAALGSGAQPAQHFQMCKWSILELESEGGPTALAKTSPKTENFMQTNVITLDFLRT